MFAMSIKSNLILKKDQFFVVKSLQFYSQCCRFVVCFYFSIFLLESSYDSDYCVCTVHTCTWLYLSLTCTIAVVGSGKSRVSAFEPKHKGEEEDSENSNEKSHEMSEYGIKVSLIYKIPSISKVHTITAIQSTSHILSMHFSIRRKYVNLSMQENIGSFLYNTKTYDFFYVEKCSIFVRTIKY